jgi:hypothetical protein
MTQIASHVPIDQPHLSFVNGTAEAAMATLDRVASVGTYVSSVAYAADGLSQALKTVAGAMARSIGTKVFWCRRAGSIRSNQRRTPRMQDTRT